VALTISEALKRHRLFLSIFAFFCYLNNATRLTFQNKAKFLNPHVDNKNIKFR